MSVPAPGVATGAGRSEADGFRRHKEPKRYQDEQPIVTRAGHDHSEQQEGYANINRNIGNVEDPNEAQFRRVEHIDHRAKSNTIKGVSNGTSDD
jgi:hypothetical protein